MAKKDWERFGRMFGKKMKDECCHDHDKGFVGRVLFIIGVLLALSQLGVTLSAWTQILIGVGFSLTRF